MTPTSWGGGVQAPSGPKTGEITCKRQYRIHEGEMEMIHQISAGSSSLSSGVNVTTAHLSKGLEFDQVIVPQVTAKNYATEIDKSMLYIACTRAMHKLTLIHSGKPSPFLETKNVDL